MARVGLRRSTPRLPCGTLTVEQRQIVEIARALAAGTRCLLLDEPTAALERGAVRRLFDRVRQLVAGGVAVLYISHHLEEVFEICQDVAVLRDGELVADAPTAERDQGAAGRGDGRRPTAGRPPASEAAPRPSAQVEAASHAASAGRRAAHRDLARAARLSGVSLEVAAGERVGVTGLLSAGVATLGRVVAGAEPYESARSCSTARPLPPRPPGPSPASRGRLHPGGPAGRGLRGQCSASPRTSTMTIVDRLSRALGWLSPATRANAAAAADRGRLSVVSSGPASRSASSPAATSRRSPSPGR